MKIKTTPDGKHAILRNGVPLYTMDNGIECEIDGAAAWKLALSKCFETSPVMARLRLPAEMMATFFGSYFTIKDGKLIAQDAHGIELYSPVRPGEVANFDEAFGMLVDRYHSKDMILREPGQGSAAAPGQQGQPGQGGTITRQQLETMPPAERMAFFKGGGKIVDGAAPAPARAPAAPSQGGKTITRAEFEQIPTLGRSGFLKAGGRIVD